MAGEELERTRVREHRRRTFNAEIRQKVQFQKKSIVSLYTFMDGVMRLPEPLEIEYHKSIHRLEEVTGMDYVTSAERFGIEKCLHQGKLEAAKSFLLKGLDRNFIKETLQLTEADLQVLDS